MSCFTGWSKTKKAIVVVVAVVAVVAIVATIFGVVTMRNSTSELIDEEATLDPALLQQGNVYTASRNSVIDKDGALIGILSAGRIKDRGLGAMLGVSSSTDAGIARTEWVPLGGSMTLDGVGTVYLTALSSYANVQRVSILIIPES